MKTNELKKGTRVKLRGTGWYATIMDNKKGNVRCADVEGFFHEMGDIYAHDIVFAKVDRPDTYAGFEWVKIEHTQAQKDLRLLVENYNND